MSAHVLLSFRVEGRGNDGYEAVLADFRESMRNVLDDASFRKHAVEEPELRVQQPLPPSPEQAALVLAGVEFALRDGPDTWRAMQDLIRRIGQRLKRSRLEGISGRLTNGTQTIAFENLPPYVADEFVPQATHALSKSRLGH